MPTATLDKIETRQAWKTEALAAECVERWKKSAGNAVEVARRLNVTAAFFWEAIDQAGARTFHEGPRMARDLAADPIDAQEVEGWRLLRAEGMTDAEIAEDAGVNVRYLRARIGFDDASVTRGGRRGPGVDMTPKLTPLFPSGPLTPTSECPHNGPIPKGSPFVCMVCHQSGHDSHPKVMFDPAADMPADPPDDYEEWSGEWVALDEESEAA